MMLDMLEHHCRIKYFCLNDSKDSIPAQANLFWNIQKELFIEKNKYLEYKEHLIILGDKSIKDVTISLQKSANADPQQDILSYSSEDWKNIFSRNPLDNLTKVIFIDSLNIPAYANSQQGYIDMRSFIRGLKIDKNHKNTELLTIILLEDHGQNCDGKIRQLIADCEFLADIVIDMGEDTRHDYQTHYIKINKKHFGPQIYGKHLFKITPRQNAFSNIEDESGPVVYPSIHK
jgi:hypothetical protein